MTTRRLTLIVAALFVATVGIVHLYAQTLGTWTYIPEGTCPTSGVASASLLCSNSADHALSFSFNAGGVQNVPQTFYTTGTYSNASTTLSDVPLLTFPVQINRSYNANCRVLWSASTGTAGPKYQWIGPGNAPTAVTSGLASPITVATFASAGANSYATTLANTATTVTSGTFFQDTLTFSVITGALGSGTVKLQAAANGTGTLTIYPGSYCQEQ